MLINNIELNSLGIVLYDRVLTTNSVTTQQEWLDGDIQPTFVRQQDKFKSMNLSFLVLTSDEQEAFMKISKLTAMLKKASIKFDDLDLIFDVTMQGGAKEERLKNGNFVVSYNFNSDYAKGEREIYTTDANATNSFKLTVLYYQNGTTLLAQESVTVRAGSFTGVGDTLDSIGVHVNKYQAEHYSAGVATNLTGGDLTYESLRSLQTLIINYTPIRYNLQIDYFIDNGTGIYNDLISVMSGFTYPQLQNVSSIGQIVDAKTYRPEGFGTRIDYTGELTVDALLKASPIRVYYDKIEKPLEKDVAIVYQYENDEGGYSDLTTAIVHYRETDFIEGMMLKDIINLDAYRPSITYYKEGIIEGLSANDLVSFDGLNTTYTVKYSKTTNTIYVEYYLGVYPDWYRSTAIPIQTKYYSSYETDFSLSVLGIDLNKYKTGSYKDGQLYNAGSFDTYDAVLNAGVIQIYYEPIDFPIVVRYYKDSITTEPLAEEELLINDLMFISNPILNDIIDITGHRPEGYQFDATASYSGEVSLAGLTQASPINIVYAEIQELKTKNVIVRYKQELASAYSVINTSLLTINEADVADGIRLKDIINLDAYRPDYYEPGIVDGASSTALITFDQLGSSYEVAYLASTYTTPVRYFTDDVDELNWIGSSSISYKVIDFSVDTTLYDLGLNINAFKPSYGSDGILQYTGPVNFTALRELEAINVVYESVEEPEDPSGIDYPHRFLFLQHNDLGDYEHLQPSWTMNHAYINTGVTVDDMSKLTVVMECAPVDKNVPLHEVIAGYGYLFGSSSQLGEFYMRFNNQTQYGSNLTGTNTYEARAGLNSNKLTLTEEAAVGFSENTGIYASDRAGYSYATFTYTNNLQSESAQMPYPLYLFANNNNGAYADGIAGVGIYSCRIYYNNVLIRDMIPVQFYDKIGSLVAPSNCLYDKVSQTFFEDGTGKNSFNIIDDDRYTDTNLEHLIGHCYVNYYKDDQLFQTATIWFRGNDFEEEWDVYEKLMVDAYQPAYYNPGQITNLTDVPVINFDNLNNKVFNVVYTAQDNFIEVNYYKDDATEENLIASERISLKEKDFYQAPTFGDIVRLNKYLPDGYETNFEYTGRKVSLGRVVEGSPYNIIYTPATDLTEYTTKIKYIKKVYGIRTYETIAEETLVLKQPNFRDGEYIDFYIDLNLHKPENYYLDGERFGWYEMDERITSPDMLLDEYTVAYQPADVAIDINYYVNSVAEENMVATTPWVIKVDTFDPRFEFTIVDELPNSYTNKFKPVNCNGGMFEDPSKLFTFETLAKQGYINIIYERIYEPDDPETAEYEPRVLYWGNLIDSLFLHGVNLDRNDQIALYVDQVFADYGIDFTDDGSYVGGRIPYIDLGYNTKDISRLRVEIKCQACSEQFASNTTTYAFQAPDYTYFFGYYAPAITDYLGTLQPARGKRATGAEFWSDDSDFSPNSAGAFAIRCRLPQASMYIYTTNGPSQVDGQTWFSADLSALGGNTGEKNVILPYKYFGMYGTFRKGYHTGTDVNWNEYVMNKEYTVSATYNKWPGSNSCYWAGQTPILGSLDDVTIDTTVPPSESITELQGPMALPFYITLDAYNNYGEIYTEYDTNSPQTIIFDTSEDDDSFEGRPQVRGSISLFQTTNPMTGKVNVQPFNHITHPDTGTMWGATGALQGVTNPYSDNYKTNVTYTQLVVTGQDESGNPIYEQKTFQRNVNFANFQVPVFPQMAGAAVWGLKLYDRDRLVRDLIPVAKGDKVFNYVMPENGLFDLVTEIFFGNSNMGGEYETRGAIRNSGSSMNQLLAVSNVKRTIPANTVYPLMVMKDPLIEGKITVNYYDYDNNFIANQWVQVPSWLHVHNEPIEARLQFNDYKPDDFHLDGMLDLDSDISFKDLSLQEIADMGSANIYYKLKTFTKTIVYYQDNVRVGSKDLFVSLSDIENAQTLEDLGIEKDLYYTEDFAHGRIVFDESIITSHDLKAFIDAPSPVVVYDKLTKEEAPNKFYVSYYRGGAYDDERIQYNPDDPNYLTCDLDAVVLNPNGAIKYTNHYHSALYEDEVFDYFIPYQVKVVNKYSGIYKGPGRKYDVLAMIVEADTYTIVEERNGWGRLKEYTRGWIDLAAVEAMYGPGQNPEYDVPDAQTATLPFATRFHITKLTIDRLWAYAPEIESWIKTEEISFDQAGKLYNGLGIQVIDLSAVDFSSVSEFEDMGIYPQAKKLHYHEFADEGYEGEFTLEAFQNLHELEFVYPETIYNINCIYYKDGLTDDHELGRAGLSFSLSDWNPDWDTFIDTSYRVDEYGNEIPPTLYRETDLVLTWDFYGASRNLYKPEGYPDGIYIWNPRTWDTDNVKFTFKEIVGIGSQKILYPNINPKGYKVQRTGGTYGRLLPNKKFYVQYQEDESIPFIYDINFETDGTVPPVYNGPVGIFTDNVSGTGTTGPFSYGSLKKTLLNDVLRNVVGGNIGGYYYTNTGFFNGMGNINIGYIPYNNQTDILNLNFSNKRTTAQAIAGVRNRNDLTDVSYYASDGPGVTTHTKITDTTNLSSLKDLILPVDYRPATAQSVYPYENIYDLVPVVNGAVIRGIHYYENFELTRYWVPVAKGMRYTAKDGTQKQFPVNGLYDIIRDAFVGSDTNTYEIYLEDKIPGVDKVYNYFEGKTFNYTDINYVVKMSADALSYMYPDIYAAPSESYDGATLKSGLIVPVTRVTADVENFIIGEWYYSCNQWFDSSNSALYADSAFNSSNLAVVKDNVLLMNKATRYLNPATMTSYSPTYPANIIRPVYYEYTNGDNKFYFDGKAWIDKSMTSGATTESNKNYAVANQTSAYKYPIADSKYEEMIYYVGDRVTILYTADANPDWGYTGKGWVQIKNNLSEIL